MAEKTCETCHWWVNPADRTIDESHAAECRRRAPSPRAAVDGGEILAQLWPVTAKTDWCGEWESKKGWFG